MADLTDPREVKRLAAEVSPTVIIHLAALIIPAIYRHPKLGRRVNVDATVALLRAAESNTHPHRRPRLDQRSVWRSQSASAPRAGARGFPAENVGPLRRA